MSVSKRLQVLVPEFRPGTVLPGKWRGHSYRIMRLVGRGANGTVYQVLRDRDVVAIKIGENAAAIALEYERMRCIEINDRQIQRCIHLLGRAKHQG